jgi:hypothetical protein
MEVMMIDPNDEADEVLAQLVGNGFFDLEVTEEGILLYKMSDNAEQIAPEIYKTMMDAMTEELLEFIKLGYVEYRLNDNLEMEYRFTPLGVQYLEAQGHTFDED